MSNSHVYVCYVHTCTHKQMRKSLSFCVLQVLQGQSGQRKGDVFQDVLRHEWIVMAESVDIFCLGVQRKTFTVTQL